MPAKLQRMGGGKTNLSMLDVTQSIQRQSQQHQSIQFQEDGHAEASRPPSGSQSDRGSSAHSRRIAGAERPHTAYGRAAQAKLVTGQTPTRAGEANTGIVGKMWEENLGGSSLSRRPSSRDRRAELLGWEENGQKSRPWTAPAYQEGAANEDVTGKDDADDIRNRPDTADSRTSSVIEAKLVEFQKSFQNKNSAKFLNMQDAFRRSDVNKNGMLGPDELAEAMLSLDIPVDKAVIDRMMRRCNKNGMTFQDFRDQLWIDDRMAVVIDERKNMRAGSKGDNFNAKYLWTPLKGPQRFVGTFNDTLEADRISAGLVPPRLDSNFSSVQYDILTHDRHTRPLDASLQIPVKNRVRLFDPPPPAGRRVAYDHGDSPYNVVTLRSPRGQGTGNPSHDRAREAMFQAPVRLVTFARIHRGEYPTQTAHMLTKTMV